MSDRLEEITQAIRHFEAVRETATSSIRELTANRDKLLSLAWIEANGVTRDQVERSDGNKPYFYHIDQFADWLERTKCGKRFCEWSGCIYFTTEVLARRYAATPGRMEDVPESGGMNFTTNLGDY